MLLIATSAFAQNTGGGQGGSSGSGTLTGLTVQNNGSGAGTVSTGIPILNFASGCTSGAVSGSTFTITCPGGSGDTITSPNSTLTVGGTSSATTLDLVGAAGKIMAGATPALTATPTLGVASTTTGTLAFANSANTGVMTLTPASGTVAATVTIPDVTTSLVGESASDTTTTHVLHASATGAVGTFSAIATGDLPTAIPIGNIGSAGLSGTAPVTISAAGAIGCATCVTSAASLTSNAIMTGAGSQASQTVADFTIGGTAHTFLAGASGLVDFSAETGTASVKLPAVAGGTSLAGTDTASLSSPITLVNTNSTNSNTSVGSIIGAAGTSTGGIGLLVFDVSGTGDLADFYNGGSVASGVYTPGTKEASISNSGALALGTANCTTFGTAGPICMGEGTAPTNVSGTTALYPDSTAHEVLVATNGSTSYGMMVRARPGAINQTSQTAAISTSTLCAASAGACNVAGQYHVHWNFWGSGTACSSVTAGSVTFLLTWTDENATTHSAVAMQMIAQTGAATTAMQSSFPFQTALANESASGDVTISTNGSVIQYGAGYTACTTGTGTFNLRATVTRTQ